MKLSIFSCVSWPFAYLLYNDCSMPLSANSKIHVCILVVSGRRINLALQIGQKWKIELISLLGMGHMFPLLPTSGNIWLDARNCWILGLSYFSMDVGTSSILMSLASLDPDPCLPSTQQDLLPGSAWVPLPSLQLRNCLQAESLRPGSTHLICYLSLRDQVLCYLSRLKRAVSYTGPSFLIVTAGG